VKKNKKTSPSACILKKKALPLIREVATKKREIWGGEQSEWSETNQDQKVSSLTHHSKEGRYSSFIIKKGTPLYDDERRGKGVKGGAINFNMHL